MAELADALDSGSSVSNNMWVQVPSETPPARLSRELVCRAKRFDKSERRLAAGQTALICYRGGMHTRSP